jgi:hypothetical protein
MTSFFTSTYFSKISSTTCEIRVMRFSSLSCVSFFTIPCKIVSSPMTLTTSFYRGTNRCVRVFCFSISCSISLYDYLFTRMTAMHSDGGIVLIFLVAFYSFSYAFLNLSSMTFIFGSSINFVQSYVISSHNFTHSLSKLLMLPTEVMVVLSLCSFSLGGVPGVVCTSNSLILVLNP